jgi:uncharacterized protein YodC (DUF2158 family)
MAFKVGDMVVHRTDKNLKASVPMIVSGQGFARTPPVTHHDELVNLGKGRDGDYYCTWMHRGKKRAEFFAEYELEPHGADQPTPQAQVSTVQPARDTNTEPLNCPHCGNPIRSP